MMRKRPRANITNYSLIAKTIWIQLCMALCCSCTSVHHDRITGIYIGVAKSLEVRSKLNLEKDSTFLCTFGVSSVPLPDDTIVGKWTIKHNRITLDIGRQNSFIQDSMNVDRHCTTLHILDETTGEAIYAAGIVKTANGKTDYYLADSNGFANIYGPFDSIQCFFLMQDSITIPAQFLYYDITIYLNTKPHPTICECYRIDRRTNVLKPRHCKNKVLYYTRQE